MTNPVSSYRPKTNKGEYGPSILCFTSLLLILVSRPRFDVGFMLNPTYLLLPLAIAAIYYRSIRVYAHEIALLIFYIYCFLSSTHSYDQALSIRFILGTSALITLFIINKAFINRVNTDDFIKILIAIGKSYCTISFILYTIALANLNNLNEHDLYAGVFIERGFPRMVGLSFDPNIFALTLLPFVFLFLVSRKFLWFLFSTTLLILSFSRGGWVSFIIGIIVLALISKPIKTIKYILIIILSLCLAYLVYAYNILGFAPIIDSRLGNISDGSGRTSIWSNAWTLFLNKPVHGWGIFSFRALNSEFFDTNQFAHNTYLEILVETGLIGISLFIASLTLLLARAYKLSLKQKSLLFLTPTFFSFASGMMFLSLYINDVFLFFILLYSLNNDHTHVNS